MTTPRARNLDKHCWDHQGHNHFGLAAPCVPAAWAVPAGRWHRPSQSIRSMHQLPFVVAFCCYFLLDATFCLYFGHRISTFWVRCSKVQRIPTAKRWMHRHGWNLVTLTAEESNNYAALGWWSTCGMTLGLLDSNVATMPRYQLSSSKIQRVIDRRIYSAYQIGKEIKAPKE